MMTSGRALCASSQEISGSGFASAKTIGFEFIPASMSGLTQFATEKTVLGLLPRLFARYGKKTITITKGGIKHT